MHAKRTRVVYRNESIVQCGYFKEQQISDGK